MGDYEEVNIKYLIIDVDGTLTDGKIYISNNGECFKVFDIKDGYGIHDILLPFGIMPIVITGRASRIVENRCRELEITELYQGVKNKVHQLNDFLVRHGGTYSNCAYIGDDINDLACMELIKGNGGLIGCPADAIQQVINIADFISNKHGGNGAVREFIEWLIESVK